jgi:hypothetical protein
MDYKLEIAKLRFESKINKTDTCWLWTAGVFTTSGYGSFRYDGKNWLAHRASWFFTYGKPADDFLLHSCDNKLCVNPAHLREGTQYENIQDMIAKGRRVLNYAENCGTAKLTYAQANEIRERYKMEKKTQSFYASEYGVNQAVISRIIQNKTYTTPPRLPTAQSPHSSE